MKKTLSLCIAVLAIFSSFVSCKTSGPEDVSALVTLSGEPAGFVITYNQVIDKSSVNKGTYSVEGYEAGKVFASTVNPFVEDEKEGKVSYVVILLRASDTHKTLEDVSVRQDSFKATNSFPINGGLMTK